MFYSTENRQLSVSFQEALMTGLAADGGLFMPASLDRLSSDELNQLAGKTFPETAFHLAGHWLRDAIDERHLKSLTRDAFDFPLPIRRLDENTHVLELFWGPTLAFKDFAARFMARCVAYFLGDGRKTVLVATSGDTGGAVGHGFSGLDGIGVFILFPASGVSPVQRTQLTRVGHNVMALEIDGTFDDCQSLAKRCFGDRDLNLKHDFMSANSINVGRIIPQSFYTFWAAMQVKKRFPNKKLMICVPSGNFGNLTGGLWAKKLGAPIYRFIAANNRNHPFCAFLDSGVFQPVPSVRTLSNAMDIGHPNNFYRILDMYDHDVDAVRKDIDGAHFDDLETKRKILDLWEKHGYLVCPHTAVGLLGVDHVRARSDSDVAFLSLATAHPAKFEDVVAPLIGRSVPPPPQLTSRTGAVEQVTRLPNDFQMLREYLMNHTW